MTSIFNRFRRFLMYGMLVGGGLWPRVRVLADDKPAPLLVEHTSIRGSVGGMHSYVPECWSLLAINVTNPHDAPREIISTTYFDGAPNLQYARRMWLPAKSRLQSWVPVLVPKLAADGATRLSFHSLVFEAGLSHDVLLKEDTGQNLHSGILAAQKESFATAFLDDPGEGPSVDSRSAYDLIIACRRAHNLSRRTTSLSEPLFAPDDFSLQPFDQIVMASSRALGDPAGLAAVRRWLYDGGRLWVMLNQVDPQVLESILGDGFACHVVDRVGLTSVRIDSTGRLRGEGSAETEYEQPVDFVRVVVDERDAEIDYTVNGWPAAFTKTFGRGVVLVTTLAPRAWMRLATPEEHKSQRESWARRNNTPVDVLQDSPFVTLPPIYALSGAMLHSRTNSHDFEQMLAVHAAEYIGYSIPSRSLVGGLLAGFGCLVVGIGTWLWQRQKLEHLGWIGPGLGVCAAAALLVVGARNRHQIESSVAALQVIEALPGADDANVAGGLAFYSPESAPWKIQSREGGRLTPEMSGLEGTTRRLLWNDLGAWTWEHLQLDTPQRTAQYQQSLTGSARLEARGTFGPNGLTGRLSAGDPARLSEVVLATRDGRIGVDLLPDGAFVASADRVFSDDQFVEAGFLRDEQDRRRRVFPLVLDEMFGEEWSGPPLFMAWTDELRLGIEFDEGRRRLGASLLVIPVVIDRPPAGTELRIPAPLLPFRMVTLPDGTPSSPVWSARRHEWLDRRDFSTVWLKFLVPQALLPIEVTGGRLIVQVTGPVNQMELFGQRHDVAGRPPGAGVAKPVIIERWNDPVGSRTFELVDRNLLQLTDGGLLLGMTIGDPERKSNDTLDFDEIKSSPWRIVHLGLELTGRIPPATPAVAIDADQIESDLNP
ncbi:MAG TPA: hypothetical protein VGM05_34210 [Planctomycetaceae bacterium]|jgi:hypothetical protein